MRIGLSKDFELRASNGRISLAGSAPFTSTRRNSRSPETRLLRMQQSPPDHVQISKCGRDLQAMQVLGKAAVANFLEPEHALDHADRVLDLGSNVRLVAVRGLDRLVDPVAPSIVLVGKVPCTRRRRAHRYRASI